MKTYRPQRSYILGTLVIFIPLLVLTVITFLNEGPIPLHEIKGLVGFWIIGTTLLLLSFGVRLQVSENNIQTFHFGISKKVIKREDVISMEYGNVIAGGIGLGKGIKLIVKGRNKNIQHSIPEYLYGKEVMSEIQKTLSNPQQ